MESPQPTVRANRFNQSKIYNFLKNHWSDYFFLLIIGGLIIGS